MTHPDQSQWMLLKDADRLNVFHSDILRLLFLFFLQKSHLVHSPLQMSVLRNAERILKIVGVFFHQAFCKPFYQEPYVICAHECLATRRAQTKQSS